MGMVKQRVTIKDIALRTGVSKSTVSRVLCADNHVSPETREKVLACAKDLNFEPNYFAKGLKTQRSKTIAYLVPNIEIMIYPAIIQAMEVETYKKGYTILLCDIQENKEIARDYIRKLKSRNVDGFIFSTAYWNSDLNDEIKEARDAGIPCLNLLRTDDSGIPSIYLNNTKASELGVDFLVSKGKKKIAFLQGNENLKLYLDRFDGYVSALKKRNIDLDPNLIWQGYCNSSMVASEEIKQKIESGIDVDAIFCSSDNLVIEALHTLHQLGLSIPKDISILGYDNVPLSEMLVPRLTTISQPFKEMGKLAIDILIDMIEGIPVEKEYVFDPILIDRDTV